MKLHTNTREVLEIKAADIIEKQISKLPHVVLGIVGGSSVTGIFKKLKERDINWKKVDIFFLDERAVPLESSESNHSVAWNAFLEDLSRHGELPLENIHSCDAYADITKSAKLYTNKLNGLFKVMNRAEHFDIVLVSSGEDGHIASLFPYHDSIKNDADGYIPVHNSPKPPSKRVSASRSLIEKSDLGVLVFFGEKKREALDRFLDEDASLEECPAKIISNIQEAHVLTDIA